MAGASYSFLYKSGGPAHSTVTCSTWRGMDSVRLYFVRDTPYDENKQPYQTGSVAARVNNDRAFRRRPGRRCQVRCWCIIKDSWKRQHHHGHLEYKNTKNCRETPGTNTRSGQVKKDGTSFDSVKSDGRNLAKQQQRNAVEKKMNTSVALDFLLTRISRTLSLDVAQSPAGSSSSASRQSLSTS